MFDTNFPEAFSEEMQEFETACKAIPEPEYFSCEFCTQLVTHENYTSHILRSHPWEQ